MYMKLYRCKCTVAQISGSIVIQLYSYTHKGIELTSSTYCTVFKSQHYAYGNVQVVYKAQTCWNKLQTVNKSKCSLYNYMVMVDIMVDLKIPHFIPTNPVSTHLRACLFGRRRHLRRALSVTMVVVSRCYALKMLGIWNKQSGWSFQPLRKILYSQLGSLFPTYGKIKYVPNHQPAIHHGMQ
jgi:hypothetical protein